MAKPNNSTKKENVQDREDKIAHETKRRVMFLSIEVAYFFAEYTPKEIKNNLWEFYSAWVEQRSKIAASNEHSDMLTFYKQLSKFLKVIYKQQKQIADIVLPKKTEHEKKD